MRQFKSQNRLCTANYRTFTYTFIIALILACMPVAADNADIHENAGTRAMTFLKIGVGAEAMSMGESQVAATDDLYAIVLESRGSRKTPTAAARPHA